MAILENQFSAYCGADHCVGVGGDLDALVFAIRSWKNLGMFESGDVVILPANT